MAGLDLTRLSHGMWREKHYDYIVSFDHHEGYQVIKQYAVPWWLPWQRALETFSLSRKCGHTLEGRRLIES